MSHTILSYGRSSELPAPAGAEITKLEGAKKIKVNDRTYHVVKDTWYELNKKNGKDIYVVVDPPHGVEVDSIPKGAFKITVDETTYYQFGRIFYRKLDSKKKASYMIVKPPF